MVERPYASTRCPGWHRVSVGVALCAAASVHAAGAADAPPDDVSALELADKAYTTTAQPASPWRLFFEGAGGAGQRRDTGAHFGIARGSLDLHVDARLAPALRGVLSDRLDLVHSAGEPPGENLNTLREAYLSWARTDDQIIDLGRFNIRNGAALGFNPTDWFKSHALRAIVDPDPAVLRENRQGTVVLQGQQLWRDASVTAAFSPRLARAADTDTDTDTFALNAGATNPTRRWLVAGSLKVNERFSPQLLVHGGADTPTQIGLNLSGLVGDATVVHGEVAAGQGHSLIAQALTLTEVGRQQQRAAVGLTYTTGFDLSLTAEAEYNSAAPDRAEWNALPGPAQQLLLATAAAGQDLPTRRQLFFFARWKDFMVQRLTLSGFVRHDLETRSRALWLEARHAWDGAELALQWQAFSGPTGSLFDAAPQPQTLQLALRWYW
jgi:hypothetical protein